MTAEATGAVLDASALLALINGEAGAERVVEALPGACIGAVNWSEVAGKLVDKGVSDADVDSHLGGLGIDVIGFDRATALTAAALRRRVPRSLSLGDRACLALGLARGATVLTADSHWREVQLAGVTITTIR